MKTIRFIINPISGVGPKDKIPKLVKELFTSDKFKVDIVFTEYAGHARELTKKAVSESIDCIVAVGGDGTVNEIAGNMVHTSSVLGIIPAGSGNGLARDLRIPLDTKRAMEVIQKGAVTQIDYCKANKHFFFCTCGVGFDALVSERFSGGKHRGSLSYMKSIISEYTKFRPDEYEIVLDDEVIKDKAFLITCANASQYGYNAYIAPQANISDGKVDVVIISSVHPVEAGPMAIQLFTKKIDKNNRLTCRSSQKVIIKRQKSGLMHIDGTPVKMGRKITIRVINAGLNVVVPLKGGMESPMQAQIHDIQSFFQELGHWVGDLTSL
ncbi:MAG: diacylglycerol kinase family lipid kinase [Dysgonamonadaceae bacterium]|nr:diacylglycerol kinase family lipid kinase [Dysgonamonadaceae bacterium]